MVSQLAWLESIAQAGGRPMIEVERMPNSDLLLKVRGFGGEIRAESVRGYSSCLCDSLTLATHLTDVNQRFTLPTRGAVYTRGSKLRDAD